MDDSLKWVVCDAILVAIEVVTQKLTWALGIQNPRATHF